MTNQIPPVSPDGQSLEYQVPVQQPQPLTADQHHANAQQAYRVARDRAQYVRQQKGHSWLIWWLILGPITLWIPAIYFSVSPNHYWHV